MADWTEILGGTAITPASWSAAATRADCRVELPPDIDAIAPGETWVRFGHPLIAGDRDVLLRLAIEITEASGDGGERSVRLRVRGWSLAGFVAEPILGLAYADASGGRVGRDPRATCDDESVARILSGVAAWGDSLFPHGVPDEVEFNGWDDLPEVPD